MPDHMPEDMLDRMPNRMSEDMSDRMPEDLPVRKCINVMVGITRSKVFFFEVQRSLFSWVHHQVFSVSYIWHLLLKFSLQFRCSTSWTSRIRCLGCLIPEFRGNQSPCSYPPKDRLWHLHWTRPNQRTYRASGSGGSTPNSSCTARLPGPNLRNGDLPWIFFLGGGTLGVPGLVNCHKKLLNMAQSK